LASSTRPKASNHHVLGNHHVNETVPSESWAYWDIAFTFSGLVMLVAGWLLLRQAQRRAAAEAVRGRTG
jgi:uncharacterized membrane protein